ncbi:MAG: hypothetical protein H6667_07890 [Ardenticatenaceae bacterium]|nr:hypothetical protein [Ardenticatenaceae bacterium]MCB9443825.1 hypothetical protein [Ardenticatenaceae bacterium]
MPQNNRRSTVVLVSLLALDLILIGFHILHRLTFRGILQSSLFSNPIFSMSEEAKLPDLFQYLKQLAIVLILLYEAKHEHRIYVIWAAIFGYLLIDDVVQIHERIGNTFQNRLPPIASLQPSEVAQSGFLVLLAFIMFGISLLVIRRTQGNNHLASIHLTILLAVAAFFGVLVDFVQGIVMNLFGISGVIKVVEDGGEMLIMSVILWYVYRLSFETIPFSRLNRFFSKHDENTTPLQDNLVDNPKSMNP